MKYALSTNRELHSASKTTVAATSVYNNTGAANAIVSVIARASTSWRPVTGSTMPNAETLREFVASKMP
jgi:hypothetical protein